MNQLTSSTLGDLNTFLASIPGENASTTNEALMDVMPTIGGRAASAASMLSASFFEDLLETQGLPRRYGAVAPERLGVKPWYAMVGWALAEPEKAAVAGSLFMLLAGGMTRLMTQAAADTMIENGAIQGSMRAQRVPQAGCCAFCGFLATRGMAYTSAEAAERVVGRGAPIGSHLLAKGIHPRGSKDLGEEFHDHCRCKIVTLSEGNEMQLGDWSEDYYDAYYDAADEIREDRTQIVKEYKTKDGSTRTRVVYADAEGNRLTPEETTKRIVALMRQRLGVK